jgi:type IV pilus assembly protein PilW
LPALQEQLVKRQTHGRPNRARGLSLIELMVAMVIGLVVVLAVTLTYLQTASGTRHAILQAQMNEDGAIALDLLVHHLRLSGYAETGADGTRIFKGLAIRGCDGGFTATTSNTAFDLLDCTGGAGNDAVAIRYQATQLNSPVVENSDEEPRPANCANESIEPGSGGTDSIADNRFYVQNDTSNDDVPTLYCRGSNGAGFGNATALIPNVESLQLRYAVTHVPADGVVPPHQVTALVPAGHASLAPPLGNWSRVAAVELCVVVRSQHPVPQDGLGANELTRYLDCSSAEVTANDRRLRRTYRTTVQLTNLRPVLPMPFETDGTVVSNPYRRLEAP